MSDLEIEHGRYRLTQLDNGTGVLSRAVDLCGTCNNCRCGTQAEPIILPAAVIKVLTGRQIEMHEIMGLATALPGGFLKGLTSRGPRPDADQGSGGSAEAPKGRRAARRSRDRVPAVGLPDQAGDSAQDSAGSAAPR